MNILNVRFREIIAKCIQLTSGEQGGTCTTDHPLLIGVPRMHATYASRDESPRRESLSVFFLTHDFLLTNAFAEQDQEQLLTRSYRSQICLGEEHKSPTTDCAWMQSF
jgi:hypothetical protein